MGPAQSGQTRMAAVTSGFGSRDAAAAGMGRGIGPLAFGVCSDSITETNPKQEERLGKVRRPEARRAASSSVC
jgi:hypothetical protein